MHAGGPRRRVAVVLEDVPAAEHEIVERRQRHDVADLRRASFGPLAETDRAHLRQRADRLGESLANGEHAGDRRRADGAEADEQDAELSAGGSDFNGCGHEEKLYHHCADDSPAARRDDPYLLVVGMTGVRMGDRIAQVGCAHGGRLAAIAGKVGLSGRAVAVVPDEASAARARKARRGAGVLRRDRDRAADEAAARRTPRSISSSSTTPAACSATMRRRAIASRRSARRSASCGRADASW